MPHRCRSAGVLSNQYSCAAPQLQAIPALWLMMTCCVGLLPNFRQRFLYGHPVGIGTPRRPSDSRLHRRIKLHHETGLPRQ